MKAQSTEPARTTRRFDARLARNMVIVLLPLTLLPILLLGGGTYLRTFTFLRDQITTQLTTLVDGQAGQIAVRMQAKDNFLATMVYDPNFTIPLNTAMRISHSSPAFIGVRDQLLFDFNTLRSTESEPSFSHFFIVNHDKIIIAASNPNWEGLDLSGSLLEEMLGQTTSKALYNASPIYQDRFTVFNTRPYIDSRGVVQATVFGVADATATRRDLMSSMVANPAMKAYLITQDGYFIGLNQAKTGLTVLAQPTDVQKTNLLSLVAGPNQGRPREFRSFDNRIVLAYGKYLPGLQAGFIAELPRQTAFAPLAGLAPYLALIILGSLVFLGAIIWLGTTSIVRPIVKLSAVTTRFAEGEWQQRADVQRNDEIGQLAYAFNQMAEELTTLYRSLESKVQARTRQVRAASEVAQIASSAPTLKELLRRIVILIIDRFGYFDASVFIVDDTGVFAMLMESGQSGSAFKRGRDYRLAVGANSVVGWVTGHNKSRVVSDTGVDPLELKNELFPESHSEAVIPISVGDYVIGALDVQTVEANAFGPEDIAALQTLADQIAISIQNIRLLETTKINLAEASLLYQTSRQIPQAETADQIYELVGGALAKTSFVTGVFSLEADCLKAQSFSDPAEEGAPRPIDRLEASPQEMRTLLPPDRPYLTVEMQKSATLPAALRELFDRYKCESIALLPIKVSGGLSALIVLGSRDYGALSGASVQPYANLAELISTAMEKVYAQENMQQRLNDLQILNSLSETISTRTELDPIFNDLHTAINQALGPVNLLVALYDPQKKTIQLPYMYENQQKISVGPIPLGEGLTSIVIRSRQPLLLRDLSQEKLNELGAKVVGEPPKSWLGIPMLVGGEVTGAIVVQDVEVKDRFTDADLRLLSTLAGQVAGSIHNVMLLNQTRLSAERERKLHEVASRIRNSASIQSILETSAVELGRALGARRASIQVGDVDPQPEHGAEG
jgi:GAF domain-containing protein/HAMP domain-containing protein